MYGCKFIHLIHECVTVYKTFNALFSNAGLKNVLKAFLKNIYIYIFIMFRMMEIVYIAMIEMTV